MSPHASPSPSPSSGFVSVFVFVFVSAPLPTPRTLSRVPAPRPLVRALLWIAAVLAAAGVAILVSGPLTVLIRGAGLSAEMGSVFRRTLLVLLLAVVMGGLRPWREMPRGAWGLYGETARPLDVLGGVALAFALLFVLAYWQGLAGWFTWDEAHGRHKLATRWPWAVGGGALIGILEETFFRGWLLATLLKRHRPLRAALIGALIFALPHAFRSTAIPTGLPASPAGALTALDLWFQNAIDLADFGPRFVGLIFLGVLLSAARLRTGSLWLGIGIHGGAHVFLQALSALTERAPERNWAGSKWLYDSPPSWLAMGLLAWWLWPSPPVGASQRRDSATSP